VLPLRFVPFHELDDRSPNVVVDGSAGPGTELVLSHWPRSDTPAEVLDDLSAQIGFRALEHPSWFEAIDVVSNNHFDQDGLVSAFTLIDPDAARARRNRLIDLARAGDFGTFESRDAARLAIAVAVMADAECSPVAAELSGLDGAARTGWLYQHLLAELPAMVDDPARVEPLWRDEDAHLSESIAGIESGTVVVEEDPRLDLAHVSVPGSWPVRPTHRFTRRDVAACHPMAINQVTACSRVLIRHGDSYHLELRYEGWVMFQSRPVLGRPDLRDLAARLDRLEGVAGAWSAEPPDALTSSLRSAGSSLAPAVVRHEVERFLADAPVAWSPFPEVRVSPNA
jgi:hypothetical protein